jgi:hypothetical protein
MVHQFKVLNFLVLMAVVSGCQKAKMTYKQPVAPVHAGPEINHYPQPQPHPIPQPQNPEIIPVYPQPVRPDKEIVIGPDPIPPTFRPSPHTPIYDDGRELDPNVFSQNQQMGIRPQIERPNIVEWFESGYVTPQLKKCGPNCEPKIEQHQCRSITLPSKPKATKVDILFVVDTSASMIEERSLIAAQMGSFIDKLNPDVDYQIAVMPAHGPQTQKSPNNFYGELYSSGPNDPQVIKYRGAQGKRSAIEELKSKMKNLPNDRSDAQGEVGLLGLYASLLHPSLNQKMKSQGFLRADAGLTVIFVADENDACYDYSMGGTPNYDGSGRRDPVEQRTFDGICRLSNGDQLTPRHVLMALDQEKKNMPIILTGIVYTSEVIPQKGDKYAPENEMGRGILDLIRMTGGNAADLANPNFGSSLAVLGDYTQSRLEFDESYLCDTQVPSSKIDLSSFEVTMTSRSGEHLATFSSSCMDAQCGQGVYPAIAEVDPSGRTQKVKVHLLESFSDIAEPSAKLKMTFKTY